MSRSDQPIRRRRSWREVLIAVVGLTPQVITETLWGLLQRKPPIRPAEIWVLTTEDGGNACRERLLDPRNGAFYRFCKEYTIRKGIIRFSTLHIRVLRNASGEPLTDIRTEEDSRAAADQISEFVRRQTERPDTRLHCSVAGGRKTMGVYLALSLQLHGREQDRLYHVLVNEPFENQPDFSYIPRKPQMLQGKDGRPLNTRDAKIALAEIPYVRVRHKIGAGRKAVESNFSQEVSHAQGRVDNLLAVPNLVVDVPNKVLRIGDHRVPLAAKRVALYAYFASHHRAYNLQDVIANGWPEILALWKKARGRNTEEKKRPADRKDIWPEISRINQAIKKAVGDPRLAEFYVIGPETGMRQWDGRYGIRIDPMKINVKT